jgi:hypothetical protein
MIQQVLIQIFAALVQGSLGPCLENSSVWDGGKSKKYFGVMHDACKKRE